MSNHIQRTSMRSTRSRSTVIVCTAALIALAGCSGDAGGEKTSASSSTSSASSEPTYDEDHIMTEVRKADKEFRALDPNDLISKDAGWVTDNYRKSYNDEQAEFKDMGVVQKGKVTTTALHRAESDPDAPGGWDVTVYNCSVSTVRAYIAGKDVTADPSDPTKDLPTGPRDSVLLDRYTTSDKGKTWQLDDSQVLTGKAEEESPCAA